MYTAKDLGDNKVMYTAYEVIANMIDKPPLNKLYFEIDCDRKRIRTAGIKTSRFNAISLSRSR